LKEEDGVCIIPAASWKGHGLGDGAVCFSSLRGEGVRGGGGGAGGAPKVAHASSLWLLSSRTGV
jgi:hypothetical protein